MKIDSKTLLFSELSDRDVASMREWARGVVLGPPPELNVESWPEWLRKWFEVSGLGDRSTLLTVTVTRVLTSLDIYSELLARQLENELYEARSIAEDYRDSLTLSEDREPLPWE